MSASTKTKADRSTAESPIDLQLIKAISHPDRLYALQILNERVASPTELGREIGCPTNKIAYHVRELARYNCIELVRTEPRRGATEHFYRATKRPELRESEWLQIPQSLRDGLLEVSLKKMGMHISASMAAGKFEGRPDRHFTYVPESVDEQGWEDMKAMLLETLDRYYEIVGESRERAATGNPTFRMGLALLGFELADGDE